MQTINGRIPPQLPAGAMKSYIIAAPLATHWNVVTCADAGCEHYLTGWDSLIDERTALGQRQAAYIRKDSGRKFTEEREKTGLTRFRFEAGQKCFGEHKARNMREDRYVERGGDWRGVVGTPRVHKNAEDWTESFALNQDRIATIAERG